jgi:DNA-binding response OmpR family regulator
MKHIFIVDDEKHIRDLIGKYLTKEGYKTTIFSNGSNVLSEMKRQRPDLIVLDIMMPGISGLDLCKEIRKESELPIIFVSAKDEEIDRILGLELGADDYLSKPFSPRELLIRIKNIFKRIEKQESVKSEVITIKDMEIDFSRRFVSCGDIEVKLTSKEYDLLSYLGRNHNMPFKREQLIENIWGYDYIGDDRMIDDLIKRLRKKLKDVNSEVSIETVWGYGYRLDE